MKTRRPMPPSRPAKASAPRPRQAQRRTALDQRRKLQEGRRALVVERSYSTSPTRQPHLASVARAPAITSSSKPCTSSLSRLISGTSRSSSSSVTRGTLTSRDGALTPCRRLALSVSPRTDESSLISSRGPAPRPACHRPRRGRSALRAFSRNVAPGAPELRNRLEGDDEVGPSELKDAGGPVAAVCADVADDAKLVSDPRRDQRDRDVSPPAPATPEDPGCAHVEQTSSLAQLGCPLRSPRQLVDEVRHGLDHGYPHHTLSAVKGTTKDDTSQWMRHQPAPAGTSLARSQCLGAPVI